MPWFKVDDGFWAHPKVLELSSAAGWLWTRAGAYAAQQLTDGRITNATLAMLGSASDSADELVAAGLWDVTRGGWQFHDWETYQPTREEVLADRAKTAERMRRYREKRRNTGAGDGVTDAATDGASSRAPTRPDPTTKPTPKGVGRRKPEVSLPDGWNPNDSAVRFAVEFGIDLGHEVSQFRLHAAANDRRQRDWDSAFRQWLGNARKWAKPGESPTPKPPRAVEVAECVRHAGYPLPCIRCDEEGSPF